MHAQFFKLFCISIWFISWIKLDIVLKYIVLPKNEKKVDDKIILL
jgi:hypothetical protein